MKGNCIEMCVEQDALGILGVRKEFALDSIRFRGAVIVSHDLDGINVQQLELTARLLTFF